MSRTYETFRDGDSIDWYARSITDAQWQDAEDSEPPTEPRFYTPRSFVPVIPPVTKDEGYNAFSEMSEEDIKNFKDSDFYR